MRTPFLVVAAVLIAGLAVLLGLHWDWHSWLVAAIVLPLLVLGFVDFFHPSDNIRRQFPLIGRFSRFAEKERHVGQETLIQNSREGQPFSLIQRKIVYKRAEDKLKNFAFGTELPYDRADREWVRHSAFPLDRRDDDIRVTVGGPRCRQPYSASIFNVSAMSFGSISSNAVLALNGGAAIGGFAQNTGEGGITEYHERFGGDLIFQLGTSYFGCRTKDGDFDPDQFKPLAQKEQVKMIEIKISQGAKAGYGAILPAKKNTKEVARYRDVEPHVELISPPHHSAFRNADEMVAFIEQLRELSDGKPIGIKFCVGTEKDVRDICRAIKAAGSGPDYIAVDGGEGGTGAGSIDAIHWVGLPLSKGLRIVDEVLRDEGLRDDIKIFAAGKIISAYDIARAKALGADVCYTARGMMFALGCVQALKCNKDTCPTGITTMNPRRVSSLVVETKKHHVANFHRNTIFAVHELLAAVALENFDDITWDIFDSWDRDSSQPRGL